MIQLSAEDKDNLIRASKIINALKQPVCQAIILTISQNENNICVSDIWHKLQIPQPQVSKYLGILRRANLVLTRREGRVIYYSVNKEEVSYVLTCCSKVL